MRALKLIMDAAQAAANSPEWPADKPFMRISGFVSDDEPIVVTVAQLNEIQGEPLTVSFEGSKPMRVPDEYLVELTGTLAGEARRLTD